MKNALRPAGDGVPLAGTRLPRPSPCSPSARPCSPCSLSSRPGSRHPCCPSGSSAWAAKL